MKYEMVAAEVVIGWSLLEFGDPPMGIVLGSMHATAEYARLKGRLGELKLRVRPEGQAPFDASVIVHIEDYSDEIGEEGIEVSVFGVDEKTYQSFFAEHIAAYEKWHERER